MLYYFLANSVLSTKVCSQIVGNLLHFAKQYLQGYTRSVHDSNDFEAESFEYLLLGLRPKSSKFEVALRAN